MKDVAPTSNRARLSADCALAVSSMLRAATSTTSTTAGGAGAGGGAGSQSGSQSGSSMKRLKIVDIHRVYGKPFDPDSDDDDDDDAGNGGKENEENEENEEMEKSSGGELPGPHPMDGYRWQVECATPEDAVRNILDDIISPFERPLTLIFVIKYRLLYVKIFLETTQKSIV